MRIPTVYCNCSGLRLPGAMRNLTCMKESFVAISFLPILAQNNLRVNEACCAMGLDCSVGSTIEPTEFCSCEEADRNSALVRLQPGYYLRILSERWINIDTGHRSWPKRCNRSTDSVAKVDPTVSECNLSSIFAPDACKARNCGSLPKSWSKIHSRCISGCSDAIRSS